MLNTIKFLYLAYLTYCRAKSTGDIQVMKLFRFNSPVAVCLVALDRKAFEVVNWADNYLRTKGDAEAIEL